MIIIDAVEPPHFLLFAPEELDDSHASDVLLKERV